MKWQGGTHPGGEFGPLNNCAEALCDHTKAKVQSDFSVGATGAFPGRVWSHRGDINHFIWQNVQGFTNRLALMAVGRGAPPYVIWVHWKKSAELWFNWCTFRSYDGYFKALKKVFRLSLKVMLINGIKIVLWVNRGLFLLSFFKARTKEQIFFFIS